MGSADISSVFVGNGGNITFISDPADYRAGFHQINNPGTVAFQYQLFGAAGSGIGLGTGGTTSTVIDHTGPYSLFGAPGLNDNNVVAVAAKRDTGGWNVLRIEGGTVDVVADPYSNVLDVGLNNADDVAFLAEVAPNMYGIFRGPDPVADKVIGDGDTLFGSTVTVLKSGGVDPTIDGPNQAGQIVFRYSLADGRSGIALATPIAELAGDYNQNGHVDAADYTVWRDCVGNGAALPNDDTLGVGADDYTRWKTHFGEGAGGGAGAGLTPGESPGTNYAVPEPNCLQLLGSGGMLLGMAAGGRQRRRFVGRSRRYAD